MISNKTKVELYNFGVAEIDITPQPGVDLYTLDEISRNSNHINSHLNASAIVINYQNESLIIVSLDLIWVDQVFSSSVKDWVSYKYGPSNINVLLVATHSHSTPQISEKIRNSARPNSEYISFLYKQICKVIEKAWENKEKCYANI